MNKRRKISKKEELKVIGFRYDMATKYQEYSKEYRAQLIQRDKEKALLDRKWWDKETNAIVKMCKTGSSNNG